MKQQGLASILLAAALIPAASANVVYSIVPITPIASQGDNNDAFEVLLTNTGPSSISVEAFSFGVTTTDTDITFTSGSTATTSAPYIFFGDSFADINSFPFASVSPQKVTANDLTNDFSAVTIAGGSAVGLGKVLYNVSPTAAPGSFTVAFSATPGDNSLADANLDPVNIDSLPSRQIQIQAAPEPSAWLLLFAGLLLLWHRRSHRAPGLARVEPMALPRRK